MYARLSGLGANCHSHSTNAPRRSSIRPRHVTRMDDRAKLELVLNRYNDTPKQRVGQAIATGMWRPHLRHASMPVTPDTTPLSAARTPTFRREWRSQRIGRLCVTLGYLEAMEAVRAQRGLRVMLFTSSRSFVFQPQASAWCL